MANLILDHVIKSYGKLRAVDDLNLEVQEGELLTLLGPSGCGKTTTLRAVSGFVTLDSGRILIGQRNITEIPPERRGIGLVFQNYALWPHMTVFQNLAFGLQLKKLPKETIKKKVEEGLSMVKLAGFESRYPRQLSGGQQQRVALARALALEPDILLLDEPLSNLDALLREQMRFEIAQIHKQSGITSIYVTHDQTEAMVISDRIAVMDRGKIVQIGKPTDIYSSPANKFVAGFMGTTSFIYGLVSEAGQDLTSVRTNSGLILKGRGSGLAKGEEVNIAVRPENIKFLYTSPGPQGEQKPNTFEVRVARASYIGELIDYQLDLKGSLVRAKGETSNPLAEGASVWIQIDPQQLSILKS